MAWRMTGVALALICCLAMAPGPASAQTALADDLYGDTGAISRDNPAWLGVMRLADDRMRARDFAGAADRFERAAGMVPDATVEKGHSLFKLALARMALRQREAALHANARAIEALAAAGDAGRALLPHTGALHRALTDAMAGAGGGRGQAALVVDAPSGDVVHGPSGARYPAGVGPWRRISHGALREDGSDIAIAYQTAGKAAKVTLYQTWARGEIGEYAEQSAALIPRSAPEARRASGGPETLQHPRNGPIPAWRVLYLSPSDSGDVAHMVMTWRMGGYLMKLRLTTAFSQYPRLETDIRALLARLTLPEA